MFALLGAKFAAVRSVAGSIFQIRCGLLAGALGVAAVVSGCSSATIPLVGADPADARANVAPVGYRSTTAPYTSLRPTAPTSWRDQNNRVAPQPRSGQ